MLITSVSRRLVEFAKQLDSTRQNDGNRAFVRLLELCVQHPVALVTEAVTEAVTRGVYQVEAVEQMVSVRLAPPTNVLPLDPERYPDYATLHLAPISLAGYNQLLPSHLVAAEERVV